ncbi:hypothetical protein Ef18B233LT_25330 [Escherichia fergusonii]|uniref:hypothetical protein n=1 Tax=Escherichia fergusonii TaxID=564 RepID=UPI0015E91302|nr:hypothetical protein [Escherichia fergusonii]EHJ4129312.1 hypothetical protein [Escherichia fergusonii]QMB01060.1 hypothetical protein HV012_08555 [Escherichia fergusonii]QMB10027.1 hypothetical protein HV010_08555 [Escherichia fergusonii]QMC63899.1 hypothetical protein HVZ69_08640 [Escherichia fergusonii]BES18703.1 hypothetical protein Ef18B233LT_25330 [Escherichia fergusonii]
MNDLKLSLIFGTLSRVITFVNQVLSVPLTIAIIGINEFTRFNVITAGIAWLITVGGCLLPSLVGDISRAKEDNNDIMISEKISSALTVMLIFIITVMIGYIFFFGVMDNERNLLLIFSILILLFSTAENVRQGLGENYKNAIYNGCSNLLSLVIILGFAYFEIKTNLQMVIIVMFGSITFFKLLNLLPLMRYFSLKYITFDSCKGMLNKATGFVFLSIAYYFNTAGLITALNWLNYTKITEFIILQKIILIVMGMVVMIRNPLWGVIAKMQYKGNSDLIIVNYRKVLRVYFYTAPLLVIISVLCIPFFLKLWAGGIVISYPDIIAFSIYLVSIVFSYINSVLYYGLELFNKISRILIVESIINIICVLFVALMGLKLNMIFIVMTITSLFINYFISKIIKRTCKYV